MYNSYDEFPGIMNLIIFNSLVVIVETVIITEDITGFFKLVNHRFIDKNKNRVIPGDSSIQ